jgi:polyisoprenoid-binding protein YceI
MLKTAVSALAAAAALTFAAGSALAQGAAADAITHDPAAVKSGDYVLDPDHGKITFSVVHMGYSIYQGQFTGVHAELHLDAAKPSASKLDAVVPVSGIATGNPKLDEHLKTADFFDLAKFPEVKFHATKIVRTGPKTARITGELTLLGATHPVTLEAEFLQAGKNPFFNAYEVGFAAHGELKRSEWGMGKYTSAPGLPGFAPVSDEVKLTFEGEFKAAQ